MAAFLLSGFSLVVYGAWTIRQQNDVYSAAQAGARAASFHETQGAALTAMQAVVEENLAQSGASCTNPPPRGRITNANFASAGATGGGPFFVEVEVTCVSSAFGRIGTSRPFTRSAIEVIDVYREE